MLKVLERIKTTTIRRKAVREKRVPLGFMGAQLRALLNLLEHHSSVVLRSFKDDAIMPRDASLSNSRYKFSTIGKTYIFEKKNSMN